MGRKSKKKKKKKGNGTPRKNRSLPGGASSGGDRRPGAAGGVPRARRSGSAYWRESETQQSIGVTVAWLLSATATLLVLVAWGVAWWIGTQWEQGMAEADAANHLSRAVFGAQLLQFAATITGLVTLCLIPIMVRLRNVPAPRRLVWATTVIGMAPVMIQLLRAYGN